MRRFKRPAKSNYFLIGLILVITGAYAFYFLAYVPDREKQITVTSYNRLEQVHKNILDKTENLKIRFENDVKNIAERLSLENEKRRLIRLQNRYANEAKKLEEIIEFQNDLIKLQESKENLKRDSSDSLKILESKIANVAYQLSAYDNPDTISIDLKDLNDSIESSKAEIIKLNKNKPEQGEKLNLCLSSSPTIRQYQIFSDQKLPGDLENCENVEDELFYMGFNTELDPSSKKKLTSVLYPVSELFNDITIVPYFDNIAILHSEKKNHSSNRTVSNNGILLTHDEGSPPEEESIHTIYSGDLPIHMMDKFVVTTMNDSLLTRNSFSDIYLDGSEYRVFARPIELMDTKLTLIGLKSKSEIQQTSRSINQYVAIVLLLVLFILIISFPFIKLFLIDKHEKLGISDMYVLGLSVIIGYAIVIITFLVLHYHYTSTIESSKSQSRAIALDLHKSFISDLRYLIECTEDFASKLSKNKNPRTDPTSLGHTFDPTISFLTLIDQPANLPRNIHRYLIDADNNQYKPKEAPKFPVIARSYYTDILKENYKHIKSSSGKTSKFAIEIVYSWRTNNPQLVLTLPPINLKTTNPEGAGVTAIPDDSKFVIGLMNQDFSPFFNTLLPPDFEYCIIDKTGEVQIHSDMTKIKRENFFDEIHDPLQIKSIISADKKESVTLSYKDQQYEAHTMPLEGLDWNLVVLKRSASDTLFEAISAYYNTLVLFIWFLLVVLITLNVKLAQRKQSILQKKRFAYSWLLPTELKITYERKTFIHLALILAQFFVYQLVDSLLYALFVHLIVILLSSITNYIMLNIPRLRLESKSKFKWWKSPYLLKHALPHVVFLVIICFLILFIFGKEFDKGFFVILILFAFMALGVLADPKNKIIAWIRRRKWYASIDRKTWYMAFLYSWLILITALPSKAYFETIATIGNQTWTKTELHDYARKLVDKYEQSKELTKSKQLSLVDYFHNQSFTQNLIRFSEFDSVEHQCDATHSKEYRLWKIFWPNSSYLYNEESIPPYQEFLSNNHNGLQCAWVKDSLIYYSWKYSPEGQNSDLLFTQRIEQRSGFLGWKIIPNTLSEWVFWILSLVVTYQIIRLIAIKGLNINLDLLFSERCHDIDRIFYPNYTPDLKETAGLEIRKAEYRAKVPGRILITSPNGSGITDKILEEFNTLEFRYSTIDLHDFDLEKEKRKLEMYPKQIILVTGLDYNLFDFEKSNDTVDLLEHIHGMDDLKCFVRSTVELDYIYNFFNVQRLQVMNDPEKFARLEKLHDRYESIFRNYIQVHFSMDWRSRNAPVPLELKGSDFMASLAPFISKEELENDKERAILQIQHYANSYFHEIWNNCTDAEKLIIYDLAEDDLLNASDSISLKNLYQKGIISKASRKSRFIAQLELFSEAFGNFILESEKFLEAKKIEREYKKKGKWQSTSLILITLIISLIVFFLFAEPHILERINSAVALAIAIVPALIRLSQGLFNFSITKAGS